MISDSQTRRKKIEAEILREIDRRGIARDPARLASLVSFAVSAGRDLDDVLLAVRQNSPDAPELFYLIRFDRQAKRAP